MIGPFANKTDAPGSALTMKLAVLLIWEPENGPLRLSGSPRAEHSTFGV